MKHMLEGDLHRIPNLVEEGGLQDLLGESDHAHRDSNE
jgi:hypothetical protein